MTLFISINPDLSRTNTTTTLNSAVYSFCASSDQNKEYLCREEIRWACKISISAKNGLFELARPAALSRVWWYIVCLSVCLKTSRHRQANIKLFTVYPLAYGRRICLCIRRVWWYMSLIWQHYYCSVMPIRPTIKKEKSFLYRCVKAQTMYAWWSQILDSPKPYPNPK